MKVIFLDVDGVLNSIETFIAMDMRGQRWSPVSVGLVRMLCEKTGAKIVVSSTWRGYSSAAQLQAEWPEFGGEPIVKYIIARTPQDNEMKGGSYPYVRGNQIKQWLSENPCDGYVILDDDSDMLTEQEPFFVQTHFNRGFGAPEYCKALRILDPSKADESLERQLGLRNQPLPSEEAR